MSALFNLCTSASFRALSYIPWIVANIFVIVSSDHALTPHRYQGQIGAALVLGGVDATGPHLFTIHPHGSTDKLPYVTMGSGSLAAMAVFESGWKPDMSVRPFSRCHLNSFPWLLSYAHSFRLVCAACSARTLLQLSLLLSLLVSSTTLAQDPTSTPASSQRTLPRCSGTSSSPTKGPRKKEDTSSGRERLLGLRRKSGV